MPQTATHIQQLGRVIIPVSDQDKSLEFYTEKLGFEVRADVPFGEADRWIEVAPSGSGAAVAIMPPRPGETPNNTQSCVAFTTDDLDAAHAELKERGGRRRRADGRRGPSAADVLLPRPGPEQPAAGRGERGLSVTELRLALTVADFDQALRFYRDALGLEQIADWSSDDGCVVVLEAGRATIELLDEAQAEYVDRIEAGHRVAGPVRLALEVSDSEETARRLMKAGAEQVAPPVTTPWGDLNARVQAPDGMQLTLFTSTG